MVRAYETMVVLHPDLGEAGTKEMIGRIRSILESGQAAIRNLDEWGLRELAYTIGKSRKGYYVLVEYDGESAAVAELERQLKLSDHVLRFLTTQQISNRRTKVEPRQGDFAEDEPSAEEMA